MPIDYLLKEVVAQKGSDLHLVVGTVPTMRLNGRLVPMGSSFITKEEVQDYMTVLLENQVKLIAKLKQENEVDFAYTLEEKWRFRVNIFKQRGSYSIALRFINHDIPSMKSLGLPDKTLEDLLASTGLVLITGPTGSGKSTTLASIVDYMNTTSALHILTLEEPIEFVHSPKKSILNQREIGIDCLSFTKGVHAALREDPDVILIGEIRDVETMRIALVAAETGHLVLSTLHTLGAEQTIERVINMFMPYEQKQICIQLAGALSGVLSQQLVEKSDGGSREVAVELMVCNDAIRNLIREGKIYQIYSVLQTSNNPRWICRSLTMEASLMALYSAHKITLEMARKYSLRKERLGHQMNWS